MRRSLPLALLLLACNPAADADTDRDDADTDRDGATTTSTADPATTLDDTARTSTTTDATTADAIDLDPVEFNCAPGPTPSDPFIDCIESFTPEGAQFGQDRLPEVVLGPPQPAAANMGSLDVLSLGCGGAITLYFDEPALVDGPGPDFIVFENPIPAGAGTFAEPARVLVSADGRDWRAFPCDPAGDPTLRGCAGVALVHPDAQTAPTDPARAGGDAFDLAELGLASARYVRLLDVSVAYHGDRTWCGGGGGGFDLDAIAAVHGP